MENNITETPIATSQVSVASESKKKFNLPVTKIMIMVAILLLIGAAGIYLYRIYGPKPVTTTGAIIKPVTYAPNDPYVELGKLLDLGTVAGDGFSIKNVSHSTSVAVFLNKPYDASQAKFQTWLKANGFGEIPQDKIVYFHNP